MKRYLSLIAVMMAFVLTLTPFSAMAEESLPEQIPEEILSILQEAGIDGEEVGQAIEGAVSTNAEGYFEMQVGDAMRELIAAETYSEDNFEWLKDLKVGVQVKNYFGITDLYATVFLNETELYHAQIEVDLIDQKLYAVCPELKKTPIVVPFGELGTGIQSGDENVLNISPEMLLMIQPMIEDFLMMASSIDTEALLVTLEEIAGNALSRIEQKSYTETLNVGALEAEMNVTELSVSAEDMQAIISYTLNTLSQTPVLAEILRSDFTNDILMLAAGGQVTGDMLLGAVQGYLQQAASADLSMIPGFYAAYGMTAQNSMPAMFTFGMQSGEFSADVFRLSFLTQDTKLAAELSAGPVAAASFGLDPTKKNSVLLELDCGGGKVNGTVSLTGNGQQLEFVKITDLNLNKDSDELTGTITINADKSYELIYSSEDQDTVVCDYLIDGKQFYTIKSSGSQVESTDIPELDTENSFVVMTSDDFEAYMRDADPISMLKLLEKAGVPKEYVEKLTDGEASTESQKENTTPAA